MSRFGGDNLSFNLLGQRQTPISELYPKTRIESCYPGWSLTASLQLARTYHRDLQALIIPVPAPFAVTARNPSDKWRYTYDIFASGRSCMREGPKFATVEEAIAAVEQRLREAGHLPPLETETPEPTIPPGPYATTKSPVTDTDPDTDTDTYDDD